MNSKQKIAVLGGGAWGTALATIILRAGHHAILWARDGKTVAAINNAHENPLYLQNIALDPALVATSDLDAAIDSAACVLAVTPAQAMRGLLDSLADRLAPGTPLILCAKGIERDTGMLMSQLAAELLPQTPIAALSGPSFATDVAAGLPTAVTIAAEDEALAVSLAALLSSAAFRCYSSSDLTGVEIGGALKNVLAIAAGAVAGAGLGASAQAALVTRGFVELRRVGVALGAEPETLMGLAGLGDLILTCSSAQSRNFAYGMALGAGENLEGRPLAEGVATAAVAARIARDNGVDAPIIAAVEALLAANITIADAVAALMARPLKSEFET